MRYVTLGNSGLEVSRIALGCMSYGDPARSTHPWTLDEESAHRFLAQALDLGINFFDTANGYSSGTSEEVLGRFLAKHARRDEVVIATKVFAPMRPGPNALGLSRKAIMTEVDASLRRLGTDYIDLYQIHRFDPRTPIEETLQALDDVVRAGKVRYLGASSMHAWQFAKALFTADLHGWTRFISMQNHYNLIHREEEREMLPLCHDQGIGVIPWSPLARGKLARNPDESTERSHNDEFGRGLYDATADADRTVIERVAEIARRRALPPARIALSWVANRPGVAAPIVGATKNHHLPDAVAALDMELTDEEVSYLEDPYIPHDVVGYA
jgi:aryl-alcohol dehydrogenase (NADP+)